MIQTPETYKEEPVRNTTIVIHRAPWDGRHGTVIWEETFDCTRENHIRSIREAKAYARRHHVVGFRVRIVRHPQIER